MEKDDLEQIIDLEKELFPSSPWSMKEFVSELDQNPFAELYVLEENGVIIGYCDLWITYEQAQIANIAVSGEYGHHGFGSEMMDHCIERAQECGCENVSLEVRTSNVKALGLYEKYGFIKVALRKNYYEDGEDAYLMIRPVGGIEYDNDTCN